jgi:hypothetical protein
VIANLRPSVKLESPRRYGGLGKAGLLGIRWEWSRRTGWHWSPDNRAEVHASSCALELGVLMVVLRLILVWEELVPRERFRAHDR